jgi:hypothetical protein
MTDYGVLYYPSFEPKHNWLLSTLLFVDSVNRIVPKEAKHVDSAWISELRSSLGADTVPSESPIPQDRWIQGVDLERMKLAFDLIIAKHHEKQAQARPVEFTFNFVHTAKIPVETKTLLEKKGLLGGYKKRAPDGYVSVERQASKLIMSYIADRIARRKGVDATTDFTQGFAINALENQGIPFQQPLNLAAGALVATIAMCQVPYEIKYLSLDSYKELRDSYEGIRESFKELSLELAAVNRLTEIEDIDTLRERIKKTADKFNRRCDDYRKTRTSRKVKKWAPWGVGALIGLATGFKGVPAALAIGGKVSQVGFQLIDKNINKPPQNPRHERAYQTICDLRARIIKQSMVKTYLHSEE